MKKNVKILLVLFLMFSITKTSAQFGKKKKKNKFECGYVHKKTLKERLNVGALTGRVVGGLFMKGSDKFDYSTTAVTIGRSNHIYPLGYIDAAFSFPGWETCGTNISATAMSKIGLPLIKIPSVNINYKAYKPVAFGQYFQAFPYQDTSEKVVEIKDNEGNAFTFNLKEMEGFKIKSVNGIPRWDPSLVYDGESDMVIELENKIDPNTKIGVELHNKVSGVRFNSPVFFCNDKNSITIPKEAFRNSLKFIEDNMLIVYKFKETLLETESVGNGAIRTVDSYYDFTPITITGKLKKSMFVKAFKKENRKVDEKDLSEVTKYDLQFKKGDPLYYHPSSEIKKIAIPSFVVRGNLSHQHVDVSTSRGSNIITTTTTTLTKWFPKLDKNVWQKLADRLYNDFEVAIHKKYNVPIVDVKKLVLADSYKKIIPIQDTVTKNFVEVGAHGTQRILPSFKKQRSAVKTSQGENLDEADNVDKGGDVTVQINTFPSDFITGRVMEEFKANCVIAVNFDFEFDIQKETLLPVVSIKFYAPSMNLNSLHYYQEVTAYYKESILFSDAAKITAGDTVDKLYTMINAPKFFSELVYALDEVSEVEKENPQYQKMFDAMQ